MNCNRANDLMMRYMDGTLAEEDEGLLHGHLAACAACDEDFSAYKEMAAAFSASDLIAAPDGLEEAVMARVRALPARARVDADTLLCFVWGGVSVLFGVGLFLFFNREALTARLADSPAFGWYTELLAPVMESAAALAARAAETAGTVSAAVYAYAASVRYLMLIVFAALAVAQCLLLLQEAKTRRRPESTSSCK